MKSILQAPIMRAFFILLIALLLFAHIANAQSRGEIKGRVTDRKTGDSLPGANVQLLGTLLGSSTDGDGYYSIKKLQPGTYTLRVSFIGYIIARSEVRVEAGAINQVDFALELSPIEMSQVIVTASREIEEIQKAVVSVSALTGETALRRNSLRMDAALESIPGVSLIGENVNVRNSSGYTRGLGSRVLVLMDGVPVLMSDFGSMNWDMLPVTDFERVEVIKGPASALYGSYALGGVINIITKAPQPQGRFSIRTSAGVYDEPYHSEWGWTDRTLQFNRVDLSYSRQIGKLGFRASLGRHESTGDRQNRHFKRWNSTLKLNWQLNDNSDFTLFGAYARDRRGEFVWSVGHNPYLVPTEFIDYRLALDAWTFYTQFRHRLNDWIEFKVRGSFVRQLTGNQFKVEGDFAPAQGPGLDVQMRAGLDSTVSFTLGAEYHYDFAEQRQIGRHFAYTVSPYAFQIWRLSPALRMTLGFRYDQYYLLPGPEIQTKTVYNPIKMREEMWTAINPLPDGKEEQYLNPQFGFSYEIAPATVVHSALGRGIRIPALGERFLQFDQPIPFQPNANILTERSTSFEFGIRQKIGYNTNLEVTAFSNGYDQLIEPVFIADETTFSATLVNIKGARIRGLEASGQFRFWNNRLRLDASATWTDPVITEIDTTTDIPVTLNEGDLLSYRPRLITFISPSINLGPFAVEADYSFASRLTREQVQLFKDDPRVDKHQLDVRFLVNWGNLTTQFAVRNLLQYNYYQVERNLNEVRSFTTGLMWSY